MRVAGILLGGGDSKRFGSPKLLAEIDGERLVDIACAHFLDAGFEPVIFCGDIQPRDEWVVCAPRGERMLETLRFGLAAAPEGPVAFAPADLPFLTPDLLKELTECFASSGKRYLVPMHGGRGGHPAFARETDAFLDPDLRGGARSVWRDAGADLVRFETSNADILYDIDTPEDLAAAATAESRRARLIARGDLSG
ncbi:MAG: nucleotidyltransferase family protein [Planctomycetota bacterium]|jgi:molybdenum cofactor cytidylyltransferase